MRRAVVVIMGILLLSSCKRDESISGDQASHFVKFVGNSGADFGNDILQTDDGGYLIVGTKEVSSVDGISANSHNDIFLCKLNQYGNLMWEKSFGGNFNDEGNNIEKTSNGGFLLCGTISKSDTSSVMLLMKLNSFGNEEWRQEYGRAGFKNSGIVAKENSDGSIIIGGNTTDPSYTQDNNDGKTDVLLTLVNSVGEFLREDGRGSLLDDEINDIVQTSSGGWAFIGTTNNPSVGSPFPNDLNKKIWIVEVNNALGNVDNFTHGVPNVDNEGNSIERLPDGNYLISGALGNLSGGATAFLAEVGGNIDDLRKFGMSVSYTSPNGIGSQKAFDAKYSQDDTYVLTGLVQTETSGTDQLLVKFDLTGQVIWDKVFGGEQDDENSALTFTQNSGYAAVGNSLTGLNSIITITKVNGDGELK